MHKLAALLVATALVGPGFIYAAIPPELKDESHRIEVKKPRVAKNRKRNKPQTLPAVSRLHNPDFPWQIPT